MTLDLPLSFERLLAELGFNTLRPRWKIHHLDGGSKQWRSRWWFRDRHHKACHHAAAAGACGAVWRRPWDWCVSVCLTAWGWAAGEIVGAAW